MFGNHRSKMPVKIYQAEAHMDSAIMGVARESGCWPSEPEEMTGIPLSMSGVVAFVGNRLVGYAYHERWARGRWKLETVVVSPTWRRAGIGRSLVLWLIKGARRAGQDAIILAVDERNLDAQLFLRSCGFLATTVDRGKGDGGDRYRFRMDLATAAKDEAACLGIWP
jgi:ribosomal protein S18 acetylase RimI-like enzyme